MARQKRSLTEKKNWRGKPYYAESAGEQLHINRQNQMVDEAAALINRIPEGVRSRIPFSQEVIDAAMTAKYLPTDPRTPYALGGALGIGAVGAGFNAFNDQQQEYLPTDPMSVAGRMASNINPFKAAQAVGVDPLADARNKLTEAGSLAGSGGVLKALAADEVNAMQARQDAIGDAVMAEDDLMMLQSVNKMIDARADQLKSTKWQDATGNIRQFTEAEAQRLATEQVNMQLRASGIY